MPFLSHSRRGRGKDSGQQREVTLASATLATRKSIRSATRVGADWQQDAWKMYDEVPELRFFARWQGNALSRAHLYIGEISPEGGGDPAPADKPGLAADLLEDLHYGQIGQSEMLRRLGNHLAITGDTYLVCLDPDPDADDEDGQRWFVASTQELRNTTAGRISVSLPDSGETRDIDPDESTVIRVWNPHPAYAWQSDSSVRSNLGVLREVKGLSAHITATIDSRLAGAGLLIIPHSASSPAPTASEDGTEPGSDPFMDGLTSYMMTAIQDQDDASAVVPIVMRVPDEAADTIKHVQLSTPLDERATTMRADALRRFARGSDVPPEIIEGKGDTNHWSSWEVSEDALRMYIEPLLGTICDALTQQYLWPAMRAAGEANPERYVIWYDTSELAQRPNRSTEAQALWDKGEISSEALRRENGFGPDDEPSEEEQQRWLALQLVRQQPALLPYLADTLGLGEVPPIPQQQGQPRLSPVPDDDTSRPELPPTENTPPPAATASAGELRWMVTAVEQAAVRALELAGNRLAGRAGRSVRQQLRGVSKWNAHTKIPDQSRDADAVDDALSGAFQALDETMPDQPCIRDAAERYCRDRLIRGLEHDQTEVMRALDSTGCLAEAS